MKYLFITFFALFYLTCNSQDIKWQFGISAGFSGVNEIIKNNTIFDSSVKFNKKINMLDNKYRNNNLHSSRVNLSMTFSRGIFKNLTVDGSFSFYAFSSTYYKEDRFAVTFDINDTINTPNWLVSKYSIPYLEVIIAKRIKLNPNVTFDIGGFVGYPVELYGTSILSLWDIIYA